MPRNRRIYQSHALFASSTATGQHFSSGNSGVNLMKQLFRIQSCNFGFGIQKSDVNQYGELGRIDSVVLQSPTVSMDFSYLLANVQNEKNLGFVVDGSATIISGLLNKTSDERNFFLKTTPEGTDAKNNTTSDNNVGVIGIGNGFITNYSTSASVGGFPTCSVSVEGLNLIYNTGISGTIPAVNPANGSRITAWNYTLPTASGSAGTGDLALSTLLPGQITLDLYTRNDDGSTGAYGALGANIADAKITSYNLGVSLSREQIQKLGNKFAFSREISFPVVATLSIDAVLGDLTTGSLSDILGCGDNFDAVISLRKDVCNPSSVQTLIAQYTLRNAELVSQNINTSIGGNDTVTLEFSCPIGGPSQTGAGVFLNGLYV